MRRLAMQGNQDIRDVQRKILEIMKYVDKLCVDNKIQYFIMGGTALGAIRHGGFIPWDDDLDIFMTYNEYKKFKSCFEADNSSQYVIQEWSTVPGYLEYAKVRMNGTTFIEEAFRNRKDLHQGIYIDIMILHKVPQNICLQKKTYYEAKFVTLLALSQRNWVPKTKMQSLALKLLKIIPCNLVAKKSYKDIYKYDNLQDKYLYCYWITPAKFNNGLFDRKYFDTDPIRVKFEDTMLFASKYIKEYLTFRYGNYMQMPSESQQKASVHALIYDTENDYTKYLA